MAVSTMDRTSKEEKYKKSLDTGKSDSIYNRNVMNRLLATFSFLHDLYDQENRIW